MNSKNRILKYCNKNTKISYNNNDYSRYYN